MTACNSVPRRWVRAGMYVDPVAPMWLVRAGILAANVLGADDVWLGDHAKALMPNALWDPTTTAFAKIMPNLDAYFDPHPIMARYTGRGRIPIGLAVTDAIRRTPADLARYWLTLHHLTRGKVLLGVGAGEAENTEPYGYSISKPVSKLEDMVAAIHAAWDSQGAALDHEGPFHHWRNATFALPPWASSYPPIYIAAQGPRACSIAGRLGDGWMQVNEGLEAWRQGCTRMVRGAIEAGRDPNRIDRMLILPSLVVGSSEDLRTICSQPFVRGFLVGCYTGRQWEIAGFDHPFGSDFGGYLEIDPTTFPLDRLTEAGRVVTPTIAEGLLCCGSARSITTTLRQYVDEGLTHVLVANLAAVYAMKAGLLGTFREQRRLLRNVKKLQVQPLRVAPVPT